MHGPVECSHFVPKMEIGGSCQFGMWMMLGIWGVSLAWVPAVISKVYRGVSGFLAPSKTKASASKQNLGSVSSAPTTRSKTKSRRNKKVD